MVHYYDYYINTLLHYDYDHYEIMKCMNVIMNEYNIIITIIDNHHDYIFMMIVMIN